MCNTETSKSNQQNDPMILNLTYAKVYVFFLYFPHKNYLECPPKSVTLQLEISFNYKISLQKDENNENPGRHFDIQRQLEHFLCLLFAKEKK